jgi:hypothetical protein
MLAYQCLKCNTVHGWVDHPNITKIRRHIWYLGEDVWYCPSCQCEHRTTDGTMFGQTQKLWKEVDPDNIELRELRIVDAWYVTRS